ncbi:MAG: sulfite exporter TauE/SafE family protein, partial [Leptospiraceae bacterium]|nr:sulfite exporter TauE/SafE family protein [Leptospiraceae bacterium]
MNSSILIAAFLNGLLGSIHCLGMCGPISMLVQTKSENYIKTNFLYNIGRTFSYTFVGSLLGSFGWGLNRFFLA